MKFDSNLCYRIIDPKKGYTRTPTGFKCILKGGCYARRPPRGLLVKARVKGRRLDKSDYDTLKYEVGKEEITNMKIHVKNHRARLESEKEQKGKEKEQKE